MSYRRLLTRKTAAWSLVASSSRLPNAMAPLAMVFLGRAGAGGYSAGTVLAACFVIGEVLGSSLLGTLSHPRRLRLNMAIGFAAGAAAFGSLAIFPDSPLVLLGVAAAVGGGAPALSPGGLRTILSRIVAERDVSRAFSVDGTVQELLWLAAPGLVVLLAVDVSSAAPMALCALSMALACVATVLLPPSREQAGGAAASARPTAAVLAGAWPIYLTSAAAMSLMAVTELVLPALLQSRNEPVGYAGVLLMVFAAVSAAASFGYGMRSWWGTARTQSLLCLLLTAGCVAVVAVGPNLMVITAGLLLAGAFQAVVLITRNLSLRAALPEAAHTAGYSIQYAVQGIGYAVAAIFAGVVLAHGTPGMAMIGGVVLTVLLAAVSTAAERAARPVPEPEAS